MHGVVGGKPAFGHVSLQVVDFLGDGVCLVMEHKRDEVVRRMLFVRSEVPALVDEN